MEKDGLKNIEAVLIGGSAGGLDIILHILPRLKKNLSIAIIIVLHRKSGYDNTLIDLLSARTFLKVKEAAEKEKISPGIIYIAPPDYHLLVEQDKTFSLDDSEKILYSRPAIDATFETAGDAYLSSVAAILLSGANADGTEGLLSIQNAGGLTIVQDPDDAEIAFMPAQALSQLKPDFILNKQEISDFINKLSHEEPD